MPRKKLAFNQGHYIDVNDDGSMQFSFNMWPTFSEQEGSLTPTKVNRTPGLVSFSTNIPTSSKYGGFTTLFSLTIYVNFGLKLYRIPENGVAVEQNNVIIGNGYTSMASNNQGIIAIVKSGEAYFFEHDAVGDVDEITDTTFLAIVGSDNLVGVVFIDGYFIFATDTTIFSASLESVNKGRNFNINDIQLTQYKSDDIRSLMATDGALWVLKRVSIEIYRNSGAAGFPFDLDTGRKLDRGGALTGRAIEIRDRVYLISKSEDSPYGVYYVSGNNFVKISTDVIDNILKGQDLDNSAFNPTTAEKLFQISHDGHDFVCLLIESENSTFLYDIQESSRVGHPVWHKRSGDPNSDQYFIRDTVAMYSKNYGIGQWLTTNPFSGLVEIDPDVSTDLGLSPLRYTSTHYVSEHTDRVKIKKFKLRHKKTSTGTVNLHYSIDRGATYFNLGGRNLSDSAEWARLGSSEDFTFIVANSADLITPNSNSSDFVLYDVTLVIT